MLAAILLSKSGITGMISGLLEGAGVPWPGAVMLAAAGTGVGALGTAVMLGTLFAVTYTCGAAVQYLIGRYSRDLLDHLLPPGTKQKLNRAIEKYGQSAVLWTRPFAIGNYVSLPAGIMRMPLGKFLLFTFVGIWPWAVGMTAAGHWVSAEVKVFSSALPALAGVMAAFTLVMAVRKWRRKPAEPSDVDCD